ncbi:hypothetical protein [Peptostreptococcus faecalis]|uniref:hypothetical protein n=1 Tax=Peptostreptococcus faecalis TaxID=2045015 RepID=UPI000C7E6529|nr:hypothetical protein [Peptostreptococcus faecalis]
MKKEIKLYVVMLLLNILNATYFILHLKADPANGLGLIMLLPVYFILSFIFGLFSGRIIRNFVISVILNVIFTALILIGSGDSYKLSTAIDLLILWGDFISSIIIYGIVGYSIGAVINKTKNKTANSKEKA